MKISPFVSFIYGLIVILSGIMSFRFENKLIALLIEIPLGAIIIGNAFFMMLEKKLSYYVLLILSFLLAIYYGYNFSQTTHFFPALLTGISFFVFVHELLKIFRVFRE